MATFPAGLEAQVGHELAASQQYVAIAVHYDAETLPRLAAFFYAQALEERNHAMMMVQYLLDADAEVTIPPMVLWPPLKSRSPTSAWPTARTKCPAPPLIRSSAR